MADANERCASDLDDGGDDIDSDEYAEDGFLRQAQGTQFPRTRGVVMTGQCCDEGGKGRVDRGAEEDRRGDDEEVLDDEIDDTVRVPNRRRGGTQAEDVADDLAKGSENQKDRKGVKTGRVEAEDVNEEEEGE